MARILSLETSTKVCSVAIHEDEKLIALVEVHQEQSHASKLAVLIDEVARQADMELKELAAVAVSSGPGSYTGLRIGTSTAKGLCYALSIPLIAVGTLEVMAAQINRVNITAAWLCPMIDARRMEVYCRLSDVDGVKLQDVEAKIIDEKSFEEQLDAHAVIFFGDGADKCRDVIRHPNAFFLSGVTPSAAQLGAMAVEKYRHQALEDLVHFEPFYLKDFRIKRPGNIIEVVSNKTV